MRLQLKRPLVIFDLETTGLEITKSRIVEIAMIKLFPNGEEKEKTIRINPQCPIPEETTAVHGITDEMVKDAPVFAEVANDIKQFVEECDLGGFNCLKFDIPMLIEEFLRADLDVLDLDTIHIVDAQKIFHQMEPRNLPAAYAFYCGKAMNNHHDATSDAKHTLAILKAQICRYDSLGETVQDIEKQVGVSTSLDTMHRIVKKNGVPTFNFGKHKGKKVRDVFQKEPNYYDWIMRSDFGLHTKKVLSGLYTSFKLEGGQKD